jgi:PAS domain-containing protein
MADWLCGCCFLPDNVVFFSSGGVYCTTWRIGQPFGFPPAPLPSASIPVSNTPGTLPATRASGLTGAPAAVNTEFLLETLPWGVLGLAPDGTVAVLNPAAEALWGVPRSAVLGNLPWQMQLAVLPAELLQALGQQEVDALPTITYWLPHTQQWISMRTALSTDDRRWVYWESVAVS